MSRHCGLSGALVFAPAAPAAQHPLPVDFSNNINYPLEYLDLSTLDDEGSRGRSGNGDYENLVPYNEAEYYSFDDYLPNGTIDLDYEDVYSDNNNKLVPDNLYPTRHPHPTSCYLIECSDPTIADLPWKLDGGLKDHNSACRTYSTCSGSSTSSQSLGADSSLPLSLSAARYEVGPCPISQSHHKTSMEQKLALSHSSSLSASQSLYDNMHPVMRKSLSTDSFRKLTTPTDPRNGVTAYSIPVIPEYSKAKHDNHTTSNRTEELLNGIVKLAEDDALFESVKVPSQTQQIRAQIKRRVSLRTSKSSPVLSVSQSQSLQSHRAAATKPSSPVTTSKRFTFSRKNSFSAHHSTDNDRKSDKKNKLSEKLSNGAHVNAFINAVEHFDIEKVAGLLATDSSCVNSVNGDGLTALDVAVLTNHVPLIRTLMRHGGRTKFLDGQADTNLCTVLQNLISGAESQVAQLKSTTTSGNAHKENEKKLNQWEFKHRLFRRMKTGYEQAGLPGQPQNVKLSVTSDSSLSLRFDAPEGANGAVIMRHKVEWSAVQNFRPLVGEVLINDMQNSSYEITGLDSGTPYYVRVTAWNMKGFGRCAYSDPQYAVPSSWRDAENLESRISSRKLDQVNTVIERVWQQRGSENSSSKTANTGSQQSSDSPPNSRKSTAPLMRGLRGLFFSSFKFQKSLKRGVYLACVCYNDDDKILVTTEENLPIVEVDESYTGNSLQADFDWLMKVVAASWDTARQLKQDLEKLSELSSMHLRHQLLTAVLQLQEIMGLQDLGRLFYKPINDGNGSIVFAIVNQINDSKQVGNMASAVKWQSQNKLTKNLQPSDPLLPLLNEMIFFHQVCANRVADGLYLGYLHVRMNVESLRVLAPENNPSVLPFIKIRDCPNVAKPEWQSILDLGLPGKPAAESHRSPDVVKFRRQLMSASRKLADKLKIPVEEFGQHRLYDVEVLDFSRTVSFILLLPPRDLVCSVRSQPLQTDATTPSSEYMEIPVKAFEMIHLHTYQNDFVSAFSKSATLVDSQLALAQHTQREAFSNEEIEKSRKLVESSRTHQQQLEEIWRSTRWLMDAITYARDKTTPGVRLTSLYRCIVERPASENGNAVRNSDDGYHSDKISLGGSDKPRTTTPNITQTQNNCNNNNGQYYDGELDDHHQLGTEESEPVDPGVLRVYAAYSTGLAKGTSVLLHVSPQTTSREVINLVVTQLRQARVQKGYQDTIYTDDQLLDFCLVAVVGPRERVLRDDYKVLHLQNPWTKGKLYVRLKNNLLAALAHGETTDV